MNKLADSTSFETPGSITPNSFHYLFAKAFLPRLEKLSVWFKVFINEAMTYEKALACADKKAHLNELLSELEEYESKFQGMENATTQLELALWNMKIEEGLQMKKRQSEGKEVFNIQKPIVQKRMSCQLRSQHHHSISDVVSISGRELIVISWN